MRYGSEGENTPTQNTPYSIDSVCVDRAKPQPVTRRRDVRLPALVAAVRAGALEAHLRVRHRLYLASVDFGERNAAGAGLELPLVRAAARGRRGLDRVDTVVDREYRPNVSQINQFVEVIEQQRLAVFGRHGERKAVPGIVDLVARGGCEAVCHRREDRLERVTGRRHRDIGRVVA